jgi:hypothetical protein
MTMVWIGVSHPTLLEDLMMFGSRFPRRIALAGAVGMATMGLAVPAAQAQSAPCVQRITVVNNAGFTMSYSIATRGGSQSPSTDTYPINQYRTVDLTSTDIPTGTDVRPVVNATAGTTQPGNRYVSFCANGQNATYTVTGTTMDYSVTLLG